MECSTANLSERDRWAEWWAGQEGGAEGAAGGPGRSPSRPALARPPRYPVATASFPRPSPSSSYIQLQERGSKNASSSVLPSIPPSIHPSLPLSLRPSLSPSPSVRPSVRSSTARPPPPHLPLLPPPFCLSSSPSASRPLPLHLPLYLPLPLPLFPASLFPSDYFPHFPLFPGPSLPLPSFLPSLFCTSISLALALSLSLSGLSSESRPTGAHRSRICSLLKENAQAPSAPRRLPDRPRSCLRQEGGAPWGWLWPLSSFIRVVE